MHGNKLYTLQPNMHKQLMEMQVMSLTPPEDIERMKSAKRRDQEQVRGQYCSSVEGCTAYGRVLHAVCRS
jgi:hypothetical protein